MKRVMHSAVTRVIAFLLAVACMVLCANAVLNGVIGYSSQELRVYDFETKFSQSNYLNGLVIEPVIAFSRAIDGYWPNGQYSFDELVQRELNAMENSDKIHYCISVNGKKYSDIMETSKSYYEDSSFYYILDFKGNGRIVTSTSYNLNMIDAENMFDNYNNKFTIYVSVKEDYAQQCEWAWNEQAGIVLKAAAQALAFLVGAILMIVLLCVVAGKNGKGEPKASWLDRVWTEIHIGIIGASGALSVALMWITAEEMVNSRFSFELARLLILSAAGAAGALIIACLLSLVRKLKGGTFLKTSIIYIVLKWAFGFIFLFLKWLGRKIKGAASLTWKFTTRKSGALIILAALVYTVIAAIFGVMLTQDELALAAIILGVLSFGALCYVFIRYARELEEIRSGVAQIRAGDLTHKIPELRHEDLRLLAQDINDIAHGLDRSVAEKLRAERMKTELITNVSHDLKTPLTSIINYTELLSRVESLPEQAQDYVKIIAGKSERLKNLTQDLFDISRAQSGNEEICCERLDVALLVNQSLGEHDNEIKASGLNFCVNLEEGLCAFADGRKMSRVVGNLISNVLKYTMKGTRVFVTAFAKDGRAEVEIKNISAYPMDFDAQEITARFVRGDESRSTEGSGLGLAIARSYTELCGGEFEVVIDGDLFKAIVKLPLDK